MSAAAEAAAIGAQVRLKTCARFASFPYHLCGRPPDAQSSLSLSHEPSDFALTHSTLGEVYEGTLFTRDAGMLVVEQYTSQVSDSKVRLSATSHTAARARPAAQWNLRVCACVRMAW